jgi:glycosyltransferase involved in cell wall biosynthesis
MIRVLFIAANPVWTAIEQAHANLFGALDRREFEVHLACTTSAHADGPSVAERASKLPNVHVHLTEFGPSLQGRTRATALDLLTGAPRLPVNFVRLARNVERWGIDVLHGSQKPYDALFAVSLAKVLRKKSVVHLHVKYEPWLGRRVRWAMKNADTIVGVSRFVADSVRGRLSVRDERLRYVNNSLDVSAWPPEGDGDRVRRELDIPLDAPLLGIVGRLNEWKGQADLLEALPLVRREHPGVRALFVGDEDPWSQGRHGYAEELRTKADALGVADIVRWSSFRNDIRDVMAAFDVFACPTWEEPFGMVFLEAMAMQKPVVAIASGAATEIIAHGETGLIAPPKDPRALASAIGELLGDREKRDRFGRAGRARAISAFAPARSGEQLAAIYRSLLRR